MANRVFPDLDALEAVLVERCRTLAADPFIGLRSFLFPAMPGKEVIKWILEFM